MGVAMEPNTGAAAVATIASATTTAMVLPPHYDYQTLVFAGALIGSLLFTFLNKQYTLLLKFPLAVISFATGYFMTPGVQIFMVNKGWIAHDNSYLGIFIAACLSSSVVAIYGYIQRKGIKGVAKDVQDIRKGSNDE